MFSYKDRANVGDLVNKNLENIDVEDDVVRFHMENGEVYRMYHRQDCCEHVRIYDIEGNPESLVESTIKSAVKRVDPDIAPSLDRHFGSYTWTYFNIEPKKGGGVLFKWLGESNGYYYEGVDIAKISDSDF